MPIVALGDCGDGARSSEWIKYHIPTVAIKLDQALDQLLRKRSRMSLGLLLGCLSSAPRWVEAIHEGLATPCLGCNRPERIRVFDELFSCNVCIGFVALQRPRALREHKDIFPAWHHVGVARTFPRAPRGSSTHGLFVPKDFGAHDKT